MIDENVNKNVYMHMKKKMLVGIIIGAFFGWLITWAMMMRRQTSIIVERPATMTVKQELNTRQMGLYQTMNKLWLEHVWWTREYLKSAASNSKDADMVARRLIKNQEDIGNAIKPIYGEAAGIQLTNLLKSHILGAVDLVKAVKSGNQKITTEANTAWYANADQIASFLNNANPNWTLSDLTTMMHMHLDLTKQEALDLIDKMDETAINDFQKVEEEIIMMSDSLSKGIIKQFPEKF